MKKVFKTSLVMLVGLGLLAMPAIANADAGDLTLKLEPGLAIPTTDPQADRFGVGTDLAGRLQIGLTENLAVSPSVSYLYLPPSSNYTASGQAWKFGGGLTVQRSHGPSNTGEGWTAGSPWLGADAQYARTGGLDRFGWSLGAGVAWPTSDDRSLWVGPFAKYQGVLQQDKPDINGNGAKIAIIGVSFEFGAAAKPKAVPPPPAPPPDRTEVTVTVVQAPPPAAPPPPAVVPEKFAFKQKVQFPWDSAVIETTQNPLLKEVTTALLANKTYSVKIAGHASSEGQTEHNNVLSQKRAQAVLDYLVKQGVSKDRLSATGFGSAYPVADNKTQAGRVANRRVEFDVTFELVKGGK